MTCGVYILHAPDGRFYIGSSRVVETRWRNHASLGRTGKHQSPKLREAYAEHGSLEPSMLLVCAPDDLAFYEQLCIDRFRPELNTSPTAGVVTMSPEGLERLRQSKLGVPRPADAVARMAATKRGRPAHNKGKPGKSPSPEHRAAISRAAKERHERNRRLKENPE